MPTLPKAPVKNAAMLARLKPLREKLIDVSLRSRLLNYRDLGSQTLPLLPCDLDTLYQWLVASEKELEVEGLRKSESRDESIESQRLTQVPHQHARVWIFPEKMLHTMLRAAHSVRVTRC